MQLKLNLKKHILQPAEYYIQINIHKTLLKKKKIKDKECFKKLLKHMIF